jgi:hypothetical protein
VEGAAVVNVALGVITVLAAAPFLVLGAAKIARRLDMPERAAHLGFSTSAYQLIGLAELLGAVGLLVGLAVTPVGIAAACGLVLLVVGAVVAHLRAGDRVSATVPALISGALVLAYLAVVMA